MYRDLELINGGNTLDGRSDMSLLECFDVDDPFETFLDDN
jgi:hypothetical protein